MMAGRCQVSILTGRIATCIALTLANRLNPHMVTAMTDLMLARPAEMIQLRYMSNIMIQPKLDGVRSCWNPNEQGFYSRNGNRLNVPHLADTLATDEYLGPFPVDGELYCHGMELGTISSAVRFQTDATPRIEFHAFDIAIHNLVAYQRVKLLDYFKLAELPGFHKVATDHLKRGSKVGEYLEQYISEGFEGVVVRSDSGFYWPGRHGSMFKFKPTVDAEYELAGFNTDSSIICQRKRTLFNVAGLSRDQMAECMSAGIGAAITVVADKAPKSGKPRFPRFKAVRAIL